MTRFVVLESSAMAIPSRINGSTASATLSLSERFSRIRFSYGARTLGLPPDDASVPVAPP